MFNKNNNENNKMDKYDIAIGLFYGAYLMLAIAIFFVVGLIYNDVVVWASAFMGCTFGFLFLELIYPFTYLFLCNLVSVLQSLSYIFKRNILPTA